MKAYLAIDFGSTYTKLTAIDLDNEVILATAKDITTVEDDIMIGFNKAFNKLILMKLISLIKPLVHQQLVD